MVSIAVVHLLHILHLHWAINLGIILHWKIHCIGNCIILVLALHWELHFSENCIAIGIELYWELHCTGIALYLPNYPNYPIT